MQSAERSKSSNDLGNQPKEVSVMQATHPIKATGLCNQPKEVCPRRIRVSVAGVKLAPYLMLSTNFSYS